MDECLRTFRMFFVMSPCFSMSICFRVALMVRCVAGSRGVRLICSCDFSFRSSCSCFSSTDRGMFAITVMALLEDARDEDEDEDDTFADEDERGR